MHWIFETVRYYLQAHGYVTVAIVLLGENAGVPLPGETVLLIASFVAYQGHRMELPWLILVGIAACTLGDNLGYWLGRWGGRPLLERWKNAFHLSEETIGMGEDFLRRRGSPAIFLARFIAGMRIVAGPLAGMLRMDWRRFVIANAAGAAIWVTVIACAGYFFGSQYEGLVQTLKWAEIAILAVLIGFLWFLWRRKKREWRSVGVSHRQ
jgi:membrane-associated protein